MGTGSAAGGCGTSTGSSATTGGDRRRHRRQRHGGRSRELRHRDARHDRLERKHGHGHLRQRGQRQLRPGRRRRCGRGDAVRRLRAGDRAGVRARAAAGAAGGAAGVPGSAAARRRRARVRRARRGVRRGGRGAARRAARSGRGAAAAATAAGLRPRRGSGGAGRAAGATTVVGGSTICTARARRPPVRGVASARTASLPTPTATTPAAITAATFAATPEPSSATPPASAAPRVRTNDGERLRERQHGEHAQRVAAHAERAAGAEDQRLDGGARDAEDARDLGVRAALELAHDDRRALVQRQLRERVEHVARARAVVDRRLGERGLELDLVRPARARPELQPADVVRDRDEPVLRRARLLAGAERAPRVEERRLGRRPPRRRGCA